VWTPQREYKKGVDRADHHELARRLRPVLPPACNWLGSGDIWITDTLPPSPGRFPEVWRGSLEGLLVSTKSFRFYSSPEFDCAEVGKVARVSGQLPHPNTAPFPGVYPSPSHPSAPLYAMMENLDTGRYPANHPNVSWLKLVSKRDLCDQSQALTNTPLSTPIAHRYFTCTEIPARTGHDPRECQDGILSPPIHWHSALSLF
jgi:hypothetical protein